MFKNIFAPSLHLVLLPVLSVNLLACGGPQAIQQLPPPIELRGVRLTDEGNVWDSRENIAAAMQFLADYNFNAVFPVVWTNGTTLYRSAVLQAWFGFELDTRASFTGRDPLAEVIEEAHKRNIAVIPSFEGGFSVGNIGNAILRTKPEWAARDRAGNAVMNDGVAWLNAFRPDVQEFLSSLVAEVARTYDIDGVQGSRRFPAQPVEAGYDSFFVADYTELHAGNAPPLNLHEKHWKYWRVVRLNTFAQQLYRKVKALRPNAVVSWATNPYPSALDEYLQDWRAWATRGADGEYYADLVHPEIRLADLEGYKRTLDAQHRDSIRVFNPRRYQYPAIVLDDRAASVPADLLKEAIRYNRFSGYNGEVFLSLEGLRKDNNRLANVLKETYYKAPARLPFHAPARKERAEERRVD